MATGIAGGMRAPAITKPLARGPACSAIAGCSPACRPCVVSQQRLEWNPCRPHRRQVNSLREIQALKRLSPHSHIIKLLEVLFDQPTGRLALVFELMVREGGLGAVLRMGAWRKRTSHEPQWAGIKVWVEWSSHRFCPVRT